jgi:membrane protease subunit HflK
MRGDNGDPLPDVFRDPNMPQIPRGAILIGLLVLFGISIVLTTFYTVEADEVAVVQRFGKYVRREAPGLHFRLPLGLETVRKVKVQRVLKAEFGFRTEEPGIRTRFSPQGFPEESLMLTGDLNVADVKWIVQYRIADPVQYLFGNRSPERSLNDVAQLVMRTVVGDHTVTEVLTERRAEIAHAAQRKMQELLKLYTTGLRVETVNLQNVTPPSDEVKRAFNEVNEAQQEKERKINEALQAYNQEIPSSRGEAERTLAQWDGSPDQIPTLDKRFILVDTTARWRIMDPLLFFQAVGDERAAQSRLDDLIDSAARDVVSGHRLIQVVRSFERELPLQDLEEAATTESRTPETGDTKAETVALPSVAEAAAPGEHLGRETLTGLMVKRAQPRLADLGIELIDVRIKRINYVREVEQKVFERMISERRRIAARFRSEGDGASAKIRGDKERELDRIRSEAYRQAQASIGKADAEAAIYATAYSQDAESYAFRQTLETYKHTLQKNSSMVLTTDSDFYRYLKNAVSDGGEPASSVSSRR